MRKLIYFLLTFVFLYIIYYAFDRGQVNYVALGDGVVLGINNYYIQEYSYSDYVKNYLAKEERLKNYHVSFYNQTIHGMLLDIQNNRTIWHNDKEYFLKKILRESDILVISIGQEELSKKYSKYNMSENRLNFDYMYQEIEQLINEIEKYAKSTIVFLGYYNPTNYYDATVDSFFYEISMKLNRLMINHNITYIDLYEKVKENNYQDRYNTPFLNGKGYQYIANIIIYYLNA